MRSVLFYADGALALNQKVSQKVAAHLFMCCNYEPDNFLVFSDDAKFLIAVDNLYKFVVDSSLIDKLNQIDQELGGTVRREKTEMVEEYRRLQNTVNDLRTFKDHNNSEKNGTFEVKDRALRWLIQITGKNEVTCAEDYKKAIQELERMGKAIYDYAEEWLTFAVSVYDKGNLIAAFESKIIAFYGQFIRRKIFEGELKMAYLSRNSIQFNAQQNIDEMIARWCRGFYCNEAEQEIKKFRSLYDQYSLKLTPKDLKKLKDSTEVKISEGKKKLESIQQEVANEVNNGEVATLRNSSYKKCYILRMLKRCTEVIPEIRAANLTMLPHDLLQYIIEMDFSPQDSTVL